MTNDNKKYKNISKMQAFLLVNYTIPSQTCTIECDLACTSNAQRMILKVKLESSNLCSGTFHSLTEHIKTLRFN